MRGAGVFFSDRISAPARETTTGSSWAAPADTHDGRQAVGIRGKVPKHARGVFLRKLRKLSGLTRNGGDKDLHGTRFLENFLFAPWVFCKVPQGASGFLKG